MKPTDPDFPDRRPMNLTPKRRAVLEALEKHGRMSAQQMREATGYREGHSALSDMELGGGVDWRRSDGPWGITPAGLRALSAEREAR